MCVRNIGCNRSSWEKCHGKRNEKKHSIYIYFFKKRGSNIPHGGRVYLEMSAPDVSRMVPQIKAARARPQATSVADWAAGRPRDTRDTLGNLSRQLARLVATGVSKTVKSGEKRDSGF